MILLMLRLRMHSKVPSKEDQKNNPALSRASAMSVRALLKGNDSWVLKRKEQSHVQATEMTSLRGIVPCVIICIKGKLRTLVYIFSVLRKLELMIMTIFGQAIWKGCRKTGTQKLPSIITL
jgi:hypothetical protein